MKYAVEQKNEMGTGQFRKKESTVKAPSETKQANTRPMGNSNTHQHSQILVCQHTKILVNLFLGARIDRQRGTTVANPLFDLIMPVLHQTAGRHDDSLVNLGLAVM